MSKQISGECMCGAVTFSMRDEFTNFYQCHCKQCQQLTGSAFASNLFTSTDNVVWHTGEELITKFSHPSRDFSKYFCSLCGSSLPFINKSGTSLIVPAGSLNERPSIPLKANIFKAEQAHWLEDGLQAKSFSGFPD